MGHTRLNKDLIQQTPVLFGEADIIKTLQTLPGVSAGTAGLAGMYVRGGNGDDNLYMIEGNPLYRGDQPCGRSVFLLQRRSRKGCRIL